MITFTPVVVRLCMVPKVYYSIVKADVVRSCGLSKGDDIILFVTSSKHVFYTRVIITFYDHVC